MFKKAHDEKPHKETHAHEQAHHEAKSRVEPETHLDPKDARIKKLEDTLIFLRDNAVQGNVNHVKTIDGALAQ